MSACVTLAMVSSCTGPLSTSQTLATDGSLATYAGFQHRSSDRETMSSKLLYVATALAGVKIFSYPKGTLVGTLSGFSLPFGLCSDKEGDVFVVDQGAQKIFEYAHGGTTPIAVLNAYGNYPNGCYVDPSTGNLAVAGGGDFMGGNVAIYHNASGSPTLYTDTHVDAFYWCTYDSSGNLFVNGGPGPTFWLDELPSGANALITIAVNQQITGGGAVQWDGRYLAIGNPHGRGAGTRGPTTIFQVQISGSSGTVKKKIELYTKRTNRNPGYDAQFWIQGNTVISPMTPNKDVGFWDYPTGGKNRKTIKVAGGGQYGITISL